MGIPGAVEGEAPPTRPYPDNDTINQAITDSVAFHNRECGIFAGPSSGVGGFADFSFSVTALEDSQGPQVINLADLMALDTRLQINTIKSVWVGYVGDDSSLRTPLRPVHVMDLERDGERWMTTPQGPAERFWISGNRLYIHPAPTRDYGVYLLSRMSLVGPISDAQGIEYLPVDYHPVIFDRAALFVAEATPQDTEMQLRIRAILPHAERGILQIKRWMFMQNEAYQAQVVPRLTRASTGVRRR